MQNDYENLAKVLMASPQGAKIVKSLDKLNSVVNTESGRQLIAMLASDGGDAIKNAAAAAASGDQDQARVLLSTLLSSPEGAQLAAKIIEVVGR
ncbi:hypothetical protein [Intestinimonas sp. MSJ-38]|uniref:hypothetical protein n=1 Tax=Intestinimonas sp. MSJ-38 TaxID=2841532 RepID=UPI000E4DCAB8|nr:hypothetical protein [Intestinimonas sp. MSJ-38]MBU5433852.1 hypothetical protein [Intestinimonas sp. MSJ-38]RHO52376.1 hypothetical protein DW094_14345 [Ruminococcaceae bacterium AM07-15]RHT70512.1 hypothetical protein DW741_10395 [Ruminococcaceae bacterium AM28-23LB]